MHPLCPHTCQLCLNRVRVRWAEPNTITHTETRTDTSNSTYDLNRAESRLACWLVQRNALLVWTDRPLLRADCATIYKSGRSRVQCKSSVKVWIDVMCSRTFDELSWRTPGCWLWGKLEVNGVEEGRINVTLKWQLTAEEKRTVVKCDSNKMIGSQRSLKNLITLEQCCSTQNRSWSRDRSEDHFFKVLVLE